MELSSPNTQSTLLLLPVVVPPGVQVKSAKVAVDPPSLSPVSSSWACMLSHFSRVQLCETPWTAARQAPLSMGFSRQEYWSGCHALLQGIFPTQELNPGLLHCRLPPIISLEGDACRLRAGRSAHSTLKSYRDGRAGRWYFLWQKWRLRPREVTLLRSPGQRQEDTGPLSPQQCSPHHPILLK